MRSIASVARLNLTRRNAQMAAQLLKPTALTSMYARSDEVYRGISTLAGRYGQGSDNLAGYELRVFSQNGEDGVTAEILHRVGAPEPYFVEFGTGNFTVGNCKYFADVLGWPGLLLEGSDRYFRRIEAAYRGNHGVRTVKSLVTPENVNSLFESSGVPRDLAVLSVDIDGQDYHVWSALEYAKPRVVVIEYNSALPSDEVLVEPKAGSEHAAWEGSDYFGASIAAMRQLGREKGYTLVYQELAGINAFFVRDDLMADFGSVQVIDRGPNFFLLGLRHPADTRDRTYDRPPGRPAASTPR